MMKLQLEALSQQFLNHHGHLLLVRTAFRIGFGLDIEQIGRKPGRTIDDLLGMQPISIRNQIIQISVERDEMTGSEAKPLSRAVGNTRFDRCHIEAGIRIGGHRRHGWCWWRNGPLRLRYRARQTERQWIRPLRPVARYRLAVRTQLAVICTPNRRNRNVHGRPIKRDFVCRNGRATLIDAVEIRLVPAAIRLGYLHHNAQVPARVQRTLPGTNNALRLILCRSLGATLAGR